MDENLSGPHWSYFKTLCDDVEKLGRFIELTPGNYGTYSIEIVRLLFATCSEIDVVFKLLCNVIAPDKKAKNIEEYREVVTQKFPFFTKTPTEAISLSLEMMPWHDWSEGKPPMWWTANNKVKHQRNAFFHAANVGNLLHALAGLCVVLCHYQQKALGEARRTWASEFIELKVHPFYRVINATGLGTREAKLDDVYHQFAMAEANRLITEREN